MNQITNGNNKTSIILFSIGAGMLFGAAATMSSPQYAMYFMLSSQFFIVAGAIASSAHFTRRIDDFANHTHNERAQMQNYFHSCDDRRDNEMDALRRELAQVESRICTNKQKDVR